MENKFDLLRSREKLSNAGRGENFGEKGEEEAREKRGEKKGKKEKFAAGTGRTVINGCWLD